MPHKKCWDVTFFFFSCFHAAAVRPILLNQCLLSLPSNLMVRTLVCNTQPSIFVLNKFSTLPAQNSILLQCLCSNSSICTIYTKVHKAEVEGCCWKDAATSLQYQLLPELAAVVAPWDRGSNLHPLLNKCPEPPFFFWIQACRLCRAAQLSLLQVAEWVVRKSSTSSICVMTLVHLLPGTQTAVAAVYSRPRAMDRCCKQWCGRCR